MKKKIVFMFFVCVLVCSTNGMKKSETEKEQKHESGRITFVWDDGGEFSGSVECQEKALTLQPNGHCYYYTKLEPELEYYEKKISQKFLELAQSFKSKKKIGESLLDKLKAYIKKNSTKKFQFIEYSDGSVDCRDIKSKGGKDYFSSEQVEDKIFVSSAKDLLKRFAKFINRVDKAKNET